MKEKMRDFRRPGTFVDLWNATSEDERRRVICFDLAVGFGGAAVIWLVFWLCGG